MHRGTVQAIGLVGAAALGAGVMFLLDPDRGALRRSRARRQAERAARWTAEKASAAAQAVVEQSRELVEQARNSPLVEAILPEQRSPLERLLAPRSLPGQVAVVLLGTALAATGGTLAARNLGAANVVH